MTNFLARNANVVADNVFTVSLYVSCIEVHMFQYCELYT